MLALVAAVSMLIGAALMLGIATTTRSVERSAASHENALLGRLLEIERGRTADLLTRLSARNIAEYHAVTVPFADDNTPARSYITDDTGLIAVEADDVQPVGEVA
jgi:hypothetical protein